MLQQSNYTKVVEAKPNGYMNNIAKGYESRSVLQNSDHSGRKLKFTEYLNLFNAISNITLKYAQNP